MIESVLRRDSDGPPDFPITARGRELQIECKNVRSGDAVFKDGFKVEIQKPHNQIGGGPAQLDRAGALPGIPGRQHDAVLRRASSTRSRSWKWRWPRQNPPLDRKRGRPRKDAAAKIGKLLFGRSSHDGGSILLASNSHPETRRHLVPQATRGS